VSFQLNFFSIPAITFRRLDLPVPFLPIIERISPCIKEKFILFKTGTPHFWYVRELFKLDLSVFIYPSADSSTHRGSSNPIVRLYVFENFFNHPLLNCGSLKTYLIQ
jgi:hypothetical protein